MAAQDSGPLASSLTDKNTWLVLGFVVLFGLLGGSIHLFSTLIASGSIQQGLLDLAAGPAAAIAVLFFIRPDDGLRLAALAVIAGVSGATILDTAQARVQASLTQAENRRLQEAGSQALTAGLRSNQIAQDLAKNHGILEKELMKALHKDRREDLRDVMPREVLEKDYQQQQQELVQYHGQLQALKNVFKLPDQ
jgi:hypothetical protein